MIAVDTPQAARFRTIRARRGALRAARAAVARAPHTPGFDDHARDEIARTVRRVVDKLLHAPTVRVKELAGSPQGDGYDLIRVCGLVDHAGERPAEYSIESTTEFRPVLQTDAEGITGYCDLVTSGDPEEDWS